ncbi:MAG: HAD family hydrolase [Candidatus Hodarchaeales archaeon]|jgi:phosphoglycolate phosphatase
MTVKAVLFDLDGTLVDSLRIFPQLIAQEFIANPTPQNIRKYLHRLGEIYNSGSRHSWFKFNMFRTIKADFKLSWIRLFLSLSKITISFFRWDASPHEFPKVVETLRELKKKGLLLGIVSNGSPRLLKKRFGKYLHLFDVLVDSKTLGKSKPSPIPLLYACNRLKVKIGESLYVGDTLVDLLAAKHSNIRIVLVKTGVFGEIFPIENVGYQPEAIIPMVGEELLQIISSI